LVDTLTDAETLRRYRDAGIEPTPVGLADTATMVRQRLQQIDAMRLTVFGRTR
jgi:hypothetical protein